MCVYVKKAVEGPDSIIQANKGEGNSGKRRKSKQPGWMHK